MTAIDDAKTAFARYNDPNDHIYRAPAPFVSIAEALVAEHERIVGGYQAERTAILRQIATPPPGWFTFGTHVDQPDIALEFWGDDGGVPIWERPINSPNVSKDLADLIAEERDKWPRVSDDMDSEDLADAILTRFNVSPKESA